MGKRGGRGGGGGGGGGGGNNRIREMDVGDSKRNNAVKLKGLTFDRTQPAFLRNALAALSGAPSSSSTSENGGRPPIPTRPGGDVDEDGPAVLSEDDEWDMGRGEEAPAVVVLNEGKHLGREEVDLMRAQGMCLPPLCPLTHADCINLPPRTTAKADDAPDPLASSSASSKSSKQASSLTFSTSGTGPMKRKADETETGKSWEEVIKRTKLDKELKETKEKEDKLKVEKSKKKEKKKQDKKKTLLSFGDDE